MAHATARGRANTHANKLDRDDRAVHDWYRFVLSFPPHLVRDYIDRFGLKPGECVLDPFCGTGTTLVEAKKLGIRSVGVERNPIAHLASRAKVDWAPDPHALLEHARQIARAAAADLAGSSIEDEPVFTPDDWPRTDLARLPPEQEALLLSGSMSPLPLHKTLVLRDKLGELANGSFTLHEQLALATTIVSASNLAFGPEVGVGPPRPDAAVLGPWLSTIRQMADDLAGLEAHGSVDARVLRADSRDLRDVIPPGTIDAVITSPPYPNEKDYTRTTRLESVLLGFICTRDDLRALKRDLVRSNTRGVYKGDDDDMWTAPFPEIQALADEIEERRLALGKTSGFERQYARVTRLYFGGMARHLAYLRPILRPGAQLAYVVGDQASYLRVMIRTGQILAKIAVSLGYEVLGIDLFRTRLATATREQLREEVVVLRWPGAS